MVPFSISYIKNCKRTAINVDIHLNFSAHNAYGSAGIIEIKTEK
jgi:hypothetical protein